MIRSSADFGWISAETTTDWPQSVKEMPKKQQTKKDLQIWTGFRLSSVVYLATI